jgi:phospholipid/cholesterol/gamma-HCH transport system ATP-binding protein
MKSIQEKYNTSALIITHDVDCARVISNRMILLVDGINYAEGTLMNYRLQQIQKCKL